MKFPKILEFNLKLDFEIWKKPLNCVYFCFSLQITPNNQKQLKFVFIAALCTWTTPSISKEILKTEMLAIFKLVA